MPFVSAMTALRFLLQVTHRGRCWFLSEVAEVLR